MNEKPILFNGEMVRAILDGRKTQTRRVIKPQPTGFPKHLTEGTTLSFTLKKKKWECPYAKRIDDRLWVRETWASHEYMDDTRPSDFTKSAQMLPLWYRANNQMHNVNQGKWRPSIFMPRWASRITLHITDVRVERVQDISEEDAIAEGVLKAGGASLSLYAARHHFSQLWDRINAKRGYGWDINPWVWVVEFRLVD
jgi:hypothetical protein